MKGRKYNYNTRRTSNHNRFSPKEIRALIAMVAALVLIVAMLILVPDLVDRARNHIVGVGGDGLVEAMEDNWLITNLSDTGAPKYSHLANVGAVEGYALEGTGFLSDANERTLYFRSENAEIEEYTVTVAKGEYDQIAADVLDSQQAVLTEVLDTSEIGSEEINGLSISYFWVNGTIDNMYDTAGNSIEPEYDADGNAIYPQKYLLSAYCYVDSPIEERSVLLSATMYNEVDNTFVDPNNMIELLKTAVYQIQYL